MPSPRHSAREFQRVGISGEFHAQPSSNPPSGYQWTRLRDAVPQRLQQRVSQTLKDEFASALFDAEQVIAGLAIPKCGAESHRGIAKSRDLAYAQYDRHAAMPDPVVHSDEY